MEQDEDRQERQRYIREDSDNQNNYRQQQEYMESEKVDIVLNEDGDGCVESQGKEMQQGQDREMTQEYVMQYLVGKKMKAGITYYRVKWLGYSSSQNTWEPKHHIDNEIIEDYEQECRLREQKRAIRLAERLEKTKKKQKHQTETIVNKQPKKAINSHTGQPKILSLSGGIFTVKEEQNTQIVTRDQLIAKDSKALASFYIDLANKIGRY